MPRTIENHGSIEILTLTDPVEPGDTVKLVFHHEDDVDPPLRVRIFSPSGERIFERVLREVPNGTPQSPPPLEFTAMLPGNYKILLEQLHGALRGEAVLFVKRAGQR